MSKIFLSLKNRGISLQNLNRIMMVLAIITSISLFFAMNRTTKVYERTHVVTRNYLDLRGDAYQLQAASDYLTEQIRCFAVTGEKQYLDKYFEEANASKRRERAIEELENRLGETEAINDLREAMNGSVELMTVEYYAGRLAAEAFEYDLEEFPEEIRGVRLTEQDQSLDREEKLHKAQELLFGENYRSQKEYISKYMQECLDDLVKMIDEKQAEAAKELRDQVFFEHVLTVVLIVILLGIVLLMVKLVFQPLRKAVELIRNEKDIPIKGAYEIRFLAKTYNLMNRANMESQEKLSHEATHDKLTGLYNRRGYDYLIKNVDWDTSALLLLDLDDFKKVNDTHGHDVGDLVLRKAADVIFKSFRSQDFVCRIGGDEFAVIMIHADAGLTGLIQNKIDKMNEILAQGDDRIPAISLCAGISFGEAMHDVDRIFKEADDALYVSKKKGKHCISFHGQD